MAPDLFGTVAVKASRGMVPAFWAAADEAWLDYTPPPETLEPLRGADEMETMFLVNRFVNHGIRYRSDTDLPGNPRDHWSTPAELLEEGAGDCEEFALFKRTLLLNLGFDPQSVWLVVLYDMVVRQHHATLVVLHNGAGRVLDNRTDNVYALEYLTDVMPYMSMGATGVYLHGRPA